MTAPDPLLDVPGVAELLPAWTADRVSEVAYKNADLVSQIIRGWEGIQEALYVLGIAKSNLDAAKRRSEPDMMNYALVFRRSEEAVNALLGGQFEKIAKFADLVAGRVTT